MIKLSTPPDYHKNMERAGDLPTCIVCGRGIRAKNPMTVALLS